MTVTDLRPFTLGGSSAAAAAGIDPFRSRIMAWAEMTGRYTREPTEAMAWGNRLEPVILAELENRGHEVVPTPSDGFADPARPWLVGHPDAFTALDGERAVLEVKTMNQWARRASDEAVPVQYQAQAMIYLHLTNCTRALVATLVGGQRLEVGTVEYDERAADLLLSLMAEFREYVRRDKPPAPDGSDSAKAAVLALFPDAEPMKVYRLNRDEWRDVRELRERREQLVTVKDQITELENRLKLAMGDAETAISPHDTDALHWRTVQARRVDTTALKAQRPDVAEEYTKVTTTRRFTLA